MKLDLVVTAGGRYGESLDEDYDNGNIVVSYLTMPIISDPHRDKITERESVDIYFEILLSILFLNYNRWSHGDLHGGSDSTGNIILREVDYVRVYTIGNTEYVVRSTHQPVIIDWGSHRKQDDLTKFSNEFYLTINGDYIEDLPSPLLEAIKKFRYSPTIFDIDYFTPLVEEQLSLGDKVKYLKPLSFSRRQVSIEY